MVTSSVRDESDVIAVIRGRNAVFMCTKGPLIPALLEVMCTLVESFSRLPSLSKAVQPIIILYVDTKL